MTTMNPTVNVAPVETWRDRIKVTRKGIFSVLFLLAGIALLLQAPRAFTSATATRLTFGNNLPEVAVPTLNYALVIAVLYAVTGILGLVPLPAGIRRLSTALVVVSGVFIIPTVLVLAAANNSTNVTVMLQVSVRLATPVALGAMAGIWCERSGVVNIAIEGMMLTGACFGFVTATLVAGSVSGDMALIIGCVVAVLAGGLISLLHAWLSIKFKTDQIVSGTVINIMAVGITSFIRREVLFSSQAGHQTFQVIRIPVLADIPVIGDVLFNGRPIFYMMFVILVVTHVVLFYTRWGLRTRAVGENPHAADTLGIDVIRTRWTNVFIGGLIAGLAGAWFTLETTGNFDDNMTGGRGFIALAAVIFGKWTPLGAFSGALLFGFSDALGQRFQFLGVPIPAQFLQMVPYVITIIVLAGLVGRAVPPKADGVPYDKGES